MAAFFLPVTLALVAAAATLAPPAAAIGWILACTGPACDHLWKPMLIWAATRSASARAMLLLPVIEGAVEGESVPEEGAVGAGTGASGLAANGGGREGVPEETVRVKPSTEISSKG